MKIPRLDPIEDKPIPDFVLKLAEGYTLYNKVATKYWTLIAIVSLVIIVPSEEPTNSKKLLMPFGLSSLAKETFYPLCFIILSLLIICFGSTFAQAIRTAKLFNQAIDDIEGGIKFSGDVCLRDITDGIVHPSLTRVAPLAQHAKESFRIVSGRLAGAYYLYLKILAIAAMYLLPGCALTVSFIKGNLALYPWNSFVFNIPIAAYYLFLSSSAIILLHLLLADAQFIKNVHGKVSKK